MDKLKNKYKVTITGLNMHHLIYFLETNKFEIENITRKDAKTIEFIISKEHFKILKKSSIISAYKLKINRSFGPNRLFKALVNKLGLFIGVGICLAFMLNISSFITTINFDTENHTCSNGQDCIFSQQNEQKMYELLAELGVKEGAKINALPNNKQIEQTLMSYFNQISGVTVSKRGSIINISIVEGKLSLANSEDLTSPVNGIIISADVTSGTLTRKVGDFVLKGETIVEHIEDKEVCATIAIRTFYHDSIIYDQEKVSYVKTGNSQNITTLTLFGKTFESNKKIKFEVYQSQTTNRYAFLNLFCPLKIQTTTYYELEPIYETIPFEDKQEELKSELYSLVKSELPVSATEKNVTYATFTESTRTRLDCYIEAMLEIKV